SCRANSVAIASRASIRRLGGSRRGSQNSPKNCISRSPAIRLCLSSIVVTMVVPDREAPVTKIIGSVAAWTMSGSVLAQHGSDLLRADVVERSQQTPRPPDAGMVLAEHGHRVTAHPRHELTAVVAVRGRRRVT